MDLYITEKVSVAEAFAKALNVPTTGKANGYFEGNGHLISWCRGHLVTMSYPDKYDESLKSWSLDTIPFIPKSYKYEIIADVAKQFKTLQTLLNRSDVDTIMWSGDSAREGEYIARLVRQMAGHNPKAEEKRVWIDSQTDAEILRGIKTAKPLSEYDNLSDSAYARAIEDYLVGINFSRAYSLKYSNLLSNAIGQKHVAIAVGRVMTCVLGMIVSRERAIRDTVTFPFYGIKANIEDSTSADWKIVKGSAYESSPDNYDNKGLLKKDLAESLIAKCNQAGTLTVIDKKASKSNKAAPLLFNLAELQAECSKRFHISPAQALQCAQDLYEAKYTTYPRTDARVLTTAVSKEIRSNLQGLSSGAYGKFTDKIMQNSWDKNLLSGHCKYVDDSKVSDHYAIIPTGVVPSEKLSDINQKVYNLICERFLSIFYPDAVYNKLQMTYKAGTETFTASYTALDTPGFLEVTGYKDDSDIRKVMDIAANQNGDLSATFEIKEGQSQPPKRYTTGSLILSMENAGNLIEDEELRSQIRGSGIGTSATRADVIEKLTNNHYIQSDEKTQTVKPTGMGEVIYDIVHLVTPDILIPEYTASWEKGLQQIVDGRISKDDYLVQLQRYVQQGTNEIKTSALQDQIAQCITVISKIYKEINPSGNRAANKPIGKCPNCGSDVLIGQYGAYCKGKCGMAFGWALGKQLSSGQVKDLLANKKVLLSGLKSKAGNSYSVYITPKGIEPYSYTKKDGTAVSGFQYVYETEFPKTNKKTQKK